MGDKGNKGDKGDKGDEGDKGDMLNQTVGKSLSVHSCRLNCLFPRMVPWL